MRNIYLNRAPIEGPWGGGNLFVRAFHEYGPRFGWQVVPAPTRDLSAILILDPRADDRGGLGAPVLAEWKKSYPHLYVMHRVNECDARKGTSDMDTMLRRCSTFSDCTVFVSAWMQEYHLKRGWHAPTTAVVYNGVDSQQFAPAQQLTPGVTKVVTHHWSNNRMKGFDAYEAIDKLAGSDPTITFTYIGRELGTFKNTTVVPPLFGAELGRALAPHDVYISGSLFDPGPNHVLESLACGLPTYVHRDGGGAVEFAGTDHVFQSAEELVALLKGKNFKRNTAIRLLSWPECIEGYCQILNENVAASSAV